MQNGLFTASPGIFVNFLSSNMRLSVVNMIDNYSDSSIFYTPKVKLSGAKLELEIRIIREQNGILLVEAHWSDHNFTIICTIFWTVCHYFTAETIYGTFLFLENIALDKGKRLPSWSFIDPSDSILPSLLYSNINMLLFTVFSDFFWQNCEIGSSCQTVDTFFNNKKVFFWKYTIFWKINEL